MASDRAAPSRLLLLPDECLLKLLQHFAAFPTKDLRSLFSAARAHSKLHQAAVAALRHVSVAVLDQQQADGLLLYLDRHGQHIDSVLLRSRLDDEDGYCTVALRQLPQNLQLRTLQLYGFRLQPQPGRGGVQGMLGAAAGLTALQHLELNGCELPDGALAAALAPLPAGLEHLSIGGPLRTGQYPSLPVTALQHLRGLTCLKLERLKLQDPDELCPTLQAMPRLVDLQLIWLDGTITAGQLAGAAPHLTRLELVWCNIEPGGLAGMPLLQHLEVRECEWCDDDDDDAAAGLPDSQQHLTHLSLLSIYRQSAIPAAALGPLAASSKLQYLDIGGCQLPEGVWQQLFPDGRQLPHLTSLNLAWAKQLDGSDAPAPDGTRLVSCCPGLQRLSMGGLQGSSQQLGDVVLQTVGLAREQAVVTQERDDLAQQVSDLQHRLQGAAAAAQAVEAAAQQAITALNGD